MNRAIALHGTAPRIVLQPLPEDVAQSISHINSILGLNSEPGIEPGALQGMSRVLKHATQALAEMREGAVPAPAALRAGAEFFSPRPLFLK